MENNTNVVGIISLICGLIGLLVYPLFLGIVALVLGIIGMNLVSKTTSTIGFILGAVDILFVIIVMSSY